MDASPTQRPADKLSLHDYFTACTNRGVCVDEAPGDEHRAISSETSIAGLLHDCSVTSLPRARNGLAGLVDSDHKLLRHQPDDANLFDSLRFDLDYEDDSDEEHFRTVVLVLQPRGSVAKLRCLHTDAHAVCTVDGGIHLQAATVNSERVHHMTG
jgi:hypothetical protein